ncbi:hypothetical protein AAFO92_12365 [Roseovarius sp. CAU 1744]
MFLGFNVGVLNWLAVVCSLVLFFLLLPGLISAAYHPIAPGVHLIPVRIVLSAVGALAFVALAIRHSRTNQTISDFRKVCELGSVPVVLLIVFQLTAVLYQQTDHLRLIYGGKIYAIPRVYRPVQSSERSTYELINVSICHKTGAPVYADTCNAYGYVELGNRPIIKQFDAYYALDQAGAAYSGDVVTKRGPDATTLHDGSFILRGGGTNTRFLLDETGRIDRFASCFLVTRNCTVSVRTSQGILTFPTHKEDVDAVEFWRAEERRWLAIFEGWKCDDENCEGQ